MSLMAIGCTRASLALLVTQLAGAVRSALDPAQSLPEQTREPERRSSGQSADQQGLQAGHQAIEACEVSLDGPENQQRNAGRQDRDLERLGQTFEQHAGQQRD